MLGDPSILTVFIQKRWDGRVQVPGDFDAPLAALRDDPVSVDGVGRAPVDTFQAIKAAEFERFDWVTVWEFAVYARL